MSEGESPNWWDQYVSDSGGAEPSLPSDIHLLRRLFDRVDAILAATHTAQSRFQRFRHWADKWKSAPVVRPLPPLPAPDIHGLGEVTLPALLEIASYLPQRFRDLLVNDIGTTIRAGESFASQKAACMQRVSELFYPGVGYSDLDIGRRPAVTDAAVELAAAEFYCAEPDTEPIPRNEQTLRQRCESDLRGPGCECRLSWRDIVLSALRILIANRIDEQPRRQSSEGVGIAGLSEGKAQSTAAKIDGELEAVVSIRNKDLERALGISAHTRRRWVGAGRIVYAEEPKKAAKIVKVQLTTFSEQERVAIRHYALGGGH